MCGVKATGSQRMYDVSPIRFLFAYNMTKCVCNISRFVCITSVVTSPLNCTVLLAHLLAAMTRNGRDLEIVFAVVKGTGVETEVLFDLWMLFMIPSQPHKSHCRLSSYI
jgi:type II secretory pathway component PulK